MMNDECNNSEPVRRTFILLPIAKQGCEAALCVFMDENPERIGSKKTSFERKVLNRYPFFIVLVSIINT